MSTAPTNSHLQIAPTAHIADKASLSSSSATPHPVIIGAHCVVHPFARLDSSTGPIALGERCVVWEKAAIGGERAAESRSRPSSTSSAAQHDQEAPRVKAIALGEGTIVHPHARIAGPATIGDHCSIGIAAEIGAGAVLGERVTVASGVKIAEGQVVEKGSVVFGEGRVRKPGWGASAEIQQDLDKARELRDAGDERHRVLTTRLVKGTAGGARFTG